MPFPLIPVIIAVATTLVVGTVATIIYSFAAADVEVKSGNQKDEADVTILFIGETEAGKDTVINLIKDRKFTPNIKKTPMYNTVIATITYKSNESSSENNNYINYKDKIKIKIINTSGSDSTFEDAERAKNLPHNIRCYIFDARKFYKDEKIKNGIQNTINECKEKNIKYMSLGTRGDEVNKEKIENKVRSMGIDCSIFELSKEPHEQVIEFLFKEYL